MNAGDYSSFNRTLMSERLYEKAVASERADRASKSRDMEAGR